jgi:hypothetical protein
MCPLSRVNFRFIVAQLCGPRHKTGPHKMPKIVKPLSDTQIKKLEPKEQEYKLAFSYCLFISIRPTARMDWRFIYTAPVTNVC